MPRRTVSYLALLHTHCFLGTPSSQRNSVIRIEFRLLQAECPYFPTLSQTTLGNFLLNMMSWRKKKCTTTYVKLHSHLHCTIGPISANPPQTLGEGLQVPSQNTFVHTICRNELTTNNTLAVAVRIRACTLVLLWA